MTQFRCLLALALAALVAAGCVRVYKVDVQQGNEINEQQVRELEPGMNRRDVRARLGTPLVEDPFRSDRWDYVYTFRAGGSKEVERKQLTLYFEEDRLVRIAGSADPQNLPVALIDVDEMQEEDRDREREIARREAESRDDDRSFWDSVETFFDNLTGGSRE